MSDEERPNLRLLRAIVFTVGVSTLGAEIAAARLMAPFFGASTIVWANTIATVLVALSIGYWLGGRLADKRPHLVQLARWVLFASVLLALVPLVADPFLDISVEAFDDIDVGAALGSLVGVLALVAVPVLLLGAVSPWAIRLSVDRVEDAGRTAGSLYALSTIGSLFGTFAATLLLIPLVGTQRTFLILAALVALVAALALPRAHLLVPAAIAALILLPTGTTKPLEGARILEERETEQQYARVVELDDGERRLELNEGQAFHSVWRRETVLTDNVWDGYLSTPISVLGRPPRSMAILGNGAGTTMRAYEKYFPATEIDGVEIDGELTELGEKWFGLRERPNARLHTDDARPFLRARGPALGGDPRRRLPPALHPVLPDHAGVLPAHQGPAGARRRGRGQRRPSRGLDQARADAGRGVARLLPARDARADHGVQHAADRLRRAALPREARGGHARRRPGRAPRARGDRRPPRPVAARR